MKDYLYRKNATDVSDLLVRISFSDASVDEFEGDEKQTIRNG